VGRTVESRLPYFRDQVRLPKKQISNSLKPFIRFDAPVEEMMQENFDRIREEVREITASHGNFQK